VNRVFVIAEAGVNHNGSEEVAVQMVEVASNAGADAVKFQTFRSDRLVSGVAETAAYQLAATGKSTQYEMLKSLELSEFLHRRLATLCATVGIEFMSTPFDEPSADFLLELGVRRFKVPSGELNNLPFLDYLARKKIPIILSTGMGTLAEVEEAVACIRTAWGDSFLPADLTLLHCTSAYPTLPGDANLQALCTMRDRCGLPVGYSDHTLGTHVSVAAVALGAQVIEKHFTLDRGLGGPDHAASLLPAELADLVRQIRDTELSLGDGAKIPREVELRTRDLVRRSVFAAVDLERGTSLTRQHLTLLRPGTGLSPSALSTLLGRRVRHAIRAGEMIRLEDIE
jgi:N,N'-diacetyllegionaminate synthase